MSTAQAVDIKVTTEGGTSAVVAGDRFSYLALAPTVTSVSPSSGPLTGGTVVTITGTNLTGTSQVMFGSVAGTAVTNVSATQVKATAPAVSTAQTVDIKVTNAGGTSAVVGADQYSYQAAPTVAAVSPASGPLAGGTVVTITGSNLSGTSQVMFGSVAGTAVTNVSATQVKATAPAVSAAQVVDIKVTTIGGTSTVVAGDQFSYLAGPPAVTSINPTSGPLAGGTVVTISGSNLSGTTQVMFGSVAGTAITVVNDQQVKATAPAVSTAEAVDIKVTTPAGTSAVVVGDQFTYQAAPAITSVSPASGPLSGGTVVTITGTNLTGTTQVMFGAVAGTSVTNVSATQVKATAPAVSSAQTVDIRVTTAGGTSAVVTGDQFGYQAVPAITSVSPASGPLAGGTVVTITGANLTGTAQVMFGSVAATSVTNVSATQVTATAPAVSSAQSVDVRVTTPGGTSGLVAGDQFSYRAAPAIVSVSPASGPLAGGTVVTISGSSLTGTSQVKFGSVPGTAVTVVNDQQVQVTTPSVSTDQTVDIQVTTAFGTSAVVAGDKFSYQSAPAITSVSPVSGSVAGGTLVTITGSSLTGTSQVKFGTVAGTEVTVVDDQHVTAIAPAGAVGPVTLTVATPGGDSAASTRYVYLSPVIAAPGGDPVTVTSPGGGQDASVSFEGVTGQRLAFHVSGVTYGAGTDPVALSIISPDGSTLVAATGFNNDGLFIDTTILPITGFYTIVVHPQAGITGQATITVLTVPTDLAFSTSPGADPLTITTLPGQNAVIRLPAVTNQPVTLDLSGVTYGAGTDPALITVLGPDDTTLIPATGFNNAGLFIGRTTLPIWGVYTIVINPQGVNAGQVQLTVNDVTDTTVATTVDGGAVTVSTINEQNAAVTFNGSADQRISVTLTDSTYPAAAGAVKVSVARPDGSILVPLVNMAGTTGFVAPFTLDATGEHTITIDPSLGAAGTVRVAVFAVPEPAHATIDVDGDYGSLTTVAPGQDGRITTELTEGVTYRLRIDGEYGHNLTMASPDGTALAAATTNWVTATDCIRTFMATQSGVHTFSLDPPGAVTGTWRLELYTSAGIPRISGPTDESPWTDQDWAYITWTVDSLFSRPPFSTASAPTPSGGESPREICLLFDAGAESSGSEHRTCQGYSTRSLRDRRAQLITGSQSR